MHGCGNDYVFVDGMVWTVAQTQAFNFATVARCVSDRHRSIGGDGLVIMLPSDRTDADARMRMFNADGSEGTLCGNALRCMAMWLHQSGRCGIHSRIAMHDRVIAAEVVSSEHDHKRAIVRVEIGTPVVLSPSAIGLQQFVRHSVLHDIFMDGQPLRIVEVSMGNPHAIVLVEEVNSLAIDNIGPQIERHPAFPDRTNVEFVQITEVDRALMRVWERGSGETQACGSGACAAAVMGWATGRFQTSVPVEVGMNGGDLMISLHLDHVISLEGSAEEAFRGVVRQ